MKGIEKIGRELSPSVLGDALVSAVNRSLYQQRHSGEYSAWKEFFQRYQSASEEELESIQQSRMREFLVHCKANSSYYRSILQDVDLDQISVTDLIHLPALEKSDLLDNLKEIATIDRENSIVSMTGGTTGNSMTVFYHPEDMQERFAFVDLFRASFGYGLGKKIVWSTGKEILSSIDLMLKRYYKHDFLHKVRFISTFHLNEASFDLYWKALEEFSPEFLLGFPSFYYDLCMYADKRGLKYSGAKTYFPTAETVTREHRRLIGEVLGCEIADQYASSEGAPFIIQCAHGNYHLQPQTGVFEVVDEKMQPAMSGELLVTSFSTRGTPLIRYRVGDSITLDDSGSLCPCGFGGRRVASIDGRTAEFLVTPEGSKISAANLSNVAKDVAGIRRLQIAQDSKNEIRVDVHADSAFDQVQEQNLAAALRERVGHSISISMQRVAEIPQEKSGKYRLVKSSISGMQ